MKTITLIKILGLTLTLILCSCTARDLKQIGLGDLYFKAGRESPDNPETQGLLDTAMGNMTYNGKQFTPAEEEQAQKALSDLRDGETISWMNPHFGKLYFGPPKIESDYLNPDGRETSTWQNKEGLTCRNYELRYIGRALGVHWYTSSHHACLKNGRWIPGSADGVSTS